MRKILIVIILCLFITGIAYAVQVVDVIPLTKTVQNSAVIVGTAVTALPATAMPGRRVLIIVNNSSNTIFWGDSNVSTSNGVPLYSKQAIAIDVSETVVIYGISGSAGNNVRVGEIR